MAFSWRILFLTGILGIACVPEDLSTPATPIGTTPTWGEGFTAKDQGQKRESLLSLSNVMGGEKSLGNPSPKDHSNAPTPKPQTDPSQGKALFQKHCARCHGAHGYGGQRMGIGVIPPVISPKVKALSAQAISQIILNGQGRMPPMNKMVDTATVSAIVVYVKSLNP